MAKHPAATAPVPDILRHHLAPGETILWSGTSAPASFIGVPLIVFIIAILLSTKLGWFLLDCIQNLFHEQPVTIDADEIAYTFTRILILGFFVPFIAGCIAICCSAFREPHENAGTCIITDRRALLIRQTRRLTTIAEWNGPDLARHTIRKRRRNRGDIILGIQERDDSDGKQLTKRGFFRIENPELASSALLQAAAHRQHPLHDVLPPPCHQPGIPLAHRETVLEHLRPGETLLWLGRPGDSLAFSRTAPFFISGIGWTSFAVAILIQLLISSASITHIVLITLFTPIGIGLLSAPWIHRRRKRRIAYALTTARILTIQLGKRKIKTIAWDYFTLQSTLLQLRPDGSGAIRFAYTDKGNHTSSAEHRFEDIPHTRETLDLAHRIHQNSGNRTI